MPDCEGEEEEELSEEKKKKKKNCGFFGREEGLMEGEFGLWWRGSLDLEVWSGEEEGWLVPEEIFEHVICIVRLEFVH